MTTESIATTRPLCKTCRYWNDIGKVASSCRFNPPHAKHGWPTTFAAHWCRRHKA